MVRGMDAAWNVARKALESTYAGKCIVMEYRNVKDDKTKLSRKAEVVVIEDQPCKLSYESLKSAQQTESAANITQIIKLFLSPDITVKAGSKVTVTQDGVTSDYKCSGIPAVYPTHQEIILDLFDRWA